MIRLKVPLARTADHPYAIETAPGKTIGGRRGGGDRQRELEPPKPLKGWGTVAIGPVR